MDGLRSKRPAATRSLGRQSWWQVVEARLPGSGTDRSGAAAFVDDHSAVGVGGAVEQVVADDVRVGHRHAVLERHRLVAGCGVARALSSWPIIANYEFRTKQSLTRPLMP